MIKNVEFDDKSLPIREFKLDMLCPNASICIIGKRGAGKSWLYRDILNHYKDLPGGIVISPVDKLQRFYSKFFPDIYIHHEYKTEIIEKLLYRQKR